MDLIKENIKLKEAKEKALVEIQKDKIGLLKEHTLHRVMKFYLCSDEKYHEIKIGKLYADVLINDCIYEVQTKAFNLMRNKLDLFLPSYNVTIVYPIAYRKNIYMTNSFGEVVSVKKSPKKGQVLDIFFELYKIKNYLKHDNLHFKIIMLNMDEYRVYTDKVRWHSKGYERENQIPNEIVEIYDINKSTDFIDILLSYNLPSTFDSKMFSKITKLTMNRASTALNVLTYLEVVCRIGKQGNSYIYKINK